MEMKPLTIALALGLAPSACTAQGLDIGKAKDFYVEDFNSENVQRCRATDVDLDNEQVQDFFTRAQLVDSKTLHDHYNFAPCYIEGVVTYEGRSCDWQIRAGATGQISCGGEVWLYACDRCAELFESKPTP
ncbi:hypothetical protein [Pseudomonas sp. RIT-PI-AD]|uniref:hypothetical protein n=1 Tax=Pseudomonas sp. RIT-PI-AD TaxID=3035294 RepID=UPI0021DA3395|nr:hypothetical protein [Pseudomonas sp. RIT-PI-AD]